jgi:hypothetical protein
VLAIVGPVVTNVAQDQLRVAPREEKLSMSWDWVKEHCTQKASYELMCSDQGAFCTNSSQCCPGLVCHAWTCR